MRMKFNKSSQLLLVSAASLLAAGLVTACGTDTTDFVYVASSRAAGPYSYGEIDVFEINSVSGAMRQIPTSPFPSGGRNPVAEAVSSDDKNLYVVNQDDNTIVQFLIGSDGKLYPQNTVNTPGIFPLAIAVSGLNLFVVDTYQPLVTCSTAAPCSGSVGVFPIQPATTGASPTSGGAPGTPVANGSLNYWPLTLPGSPNDVIVPTAVNVLQSGVTLFVTAYDSSVTPNVGYVFGFLIAPPSTATIPPSGICPSSGATSIPAGTLLPGTLCPMNGGVPFAAGTHPSAIASDSSSTDVYVTDSTNGNVSGYKVASGLLTSLSGSPFPAGNQPSAIVADFKYPYVYVANALDGNVSAYSIGSDGALTRIGAYDAGVQPVAIGIDPSTNHFVFTVNFLGPNVSDFELNSTDGSLINTQHSPYTSNAQPTAVAAIAHGSPPK
jgi:6-phosphogluconolactonase